MSASPSSMPDTAQKGDNPGVAQKPLWISKAIAEHPMKVIGVWCACLLAMIIVIGAGSFFQVAEQGDYDYLVSSDEDTLRIDALANAVESAGSSGDKQVPARTTFRDDWWFSIMYVAKDGGNALTAAAVQDMCELESILLDHKDWSKYYRLAPDSSNSGALVKDPGAEVSFANFAYSTANVSRSGCPALSEAAVENAITMARANLTQYGYWFDKNFANSGKAEAARSIFWLGTPLEGFKNKEDRRADQDKKAQDFLWEVQNEMADKLGYPKSSALQSRFMHTKSTDQDIKPYFAGSLTFNSEFAIMTTMDLTWAIFSLFWVFFFIAAYTQSFMFAAFGMFQIVMCFPLAFFLYRVVGQVDFFNFLSFLTIFVILGIGADDIFVLVDAWKQSACEPAEISGSPLARMDWTWRRASTAMLVTSLTTAAAFFATAVSRIMPIAAFGIYAGTVICANYVSVITFFPAVVIVHHKYFAKKKCCCCGTKNIDEESAEAKKRPELSRLERWFRDTYSKLILSKAAYVIVTIFTVLLGLAIWQAVSIGPLTEAEQWFPDSHMMQVFFSGQDEIFAASDQDSLVPVNVAWGIEGVDKSELSRWDPNQRASVKFDPDFDMTTNTQAKLDFLGSVCEQLEAAPCSVGGCFDGKLISAVTLCPFSTIDGRPKFLLNSSSPLSFVDQLQAFKTANSIYDANIGIDTSVTPNKVVFLSIEAKTTLRRFQASADSEPVYETMESFVEKQNQNPNSPGDAMQVAQGFAWAWMRMEQAMVSNALNGLAICFPIAFVVLALSSMNILTAVFGIISIAGIVSFVMTVANTFLDWSLGTAESIAVVITIGYSVDFTVHLSHMYLEAPNEDRRSRVHHALTYMGATIIGGATTTFGAGVFLFGCQLLFFTKFAVFMVVTISSSLVWSLLFFVSALSIAGPEGNFGSLEPWFAAVKRLFGGKEEKSASNDLHMHEVQSGEEAVGTQPASQPNGGGNAVQAC